MKSTPSEGASMAVNQQDNLRIARLRGNAEAAEAAARLQREKAERIAASTGSYARSARTRLAAAVADAAQEQADLSRAKLVTAIEARDPAYLAFLETYRYADYLADGKVGPLAAFRAATDDLAERAEEELRARGWLA